MRLKLAGGGGSVELNDSAFATDFNESLIHQVLTAYMAGSRSGTKKQKNRSQVRGGGTKPWNQKGTGRARAGTIRSPIWVGGGRTFAAKPRDYSQKVNRKMYRGALRSMLSEMVRQQRLQVIEEFTVSAPKTKELLTKLKELDMGSSVLIVVDELDVNLLLAARNLPYVTVTDDEDLNPVSLIGHEQVLMTVGAARLLEEQLA